MPATRSASPPTPPDAPAPGSSLGRYQLRRIIGRGSTSTVWLAWDPATQREVAIKCIDPDVLNDHARGRLHRNLLINEASLADKLKHPHIVAIHDAVIGDDQAWIGGADIHEMATLTPETVADIEAERSGTRPISAAPPPVAGKGDDTQQMNLFN